jgi:outer membrane immunogenic protein
VASGNWLYYATGGPAWGHTSTAFSVIYNGAPTTLAATTFNDTRFGYAAGGGVEAALWRDWTFKAEYLYLNLGSVTDGILLPPAIAAGFPQAFTLRSTVHDNIFRVGANYRFSGLPF